MNYINLINLLTVSDTANKFWKNFKLEVEDLIDDFESFFLMIKANTYDVLCEHFDPFVVNIFGLAILFLIVMLVATKIINK